MRQPGTDAIALNGVTRVFGTHPAIVGVRLVVGRGEVVLLQGPNGAGKSTLLRVVATALSPTWGGGAVLGFDLVRQRDQVRRRADLLGHRTRLYQDLTAAENLRFSCTLHGADPRRVPEALERVGLDAVAGERVGGFSQGMRQRLALARAVLREPDLLLLDEPYAGLDAEARRIVDEPKGLIQFMGLRQPKPAAATFRSYLEVAPFGSHRTEAEQLLQLAAAGVIPTR